MRLLRGASAVSLSLMIALWISADSFGYCRVVAQHGRQHSNDVVCRQPEAWIARAMYLRGKRVGVAGAGGTATERPRALYRNRPPNGEVLKSSTTLPPGLRNSNSADQCWSFFKKRHGRFHKDMFLQAIRFFEIVHGTKART
jgi:cation diffusion facilitator CzcD-associated flavoprotein CzcO